MTVPTMEAPPPLGDWVLEVYQTEMGVWHPLEQGSEEVVRVRYAWYLENRPDLEEQLRVRNLAEEE